MQWFLSSFPNPLLPWKKYENIVIFICSYAFRDHEFDNKCRLFKQHSVFYLIVMLSLISVRLPVQRHRKFSHVLGHTSENNSITTLPTAIMWHTERLYNVTREFIQWVYTWGGNGHLLTKHIADGYVEEAAWTLDLYSHRWFPPTTNTKQFKSWSTTSLNTHMLTTIT